MVTAKGLATMTVHKHEHNFSQFLKHLAASVGDAVDAPFEIATVTITTNEINTDNESDFSGYSMLSEGDVGCRLFLAAELENTGVNDVDTSDVSDISSVPGLDVDDTSSLKSIDSDVLETLENNLHNSSFSHLMMRCLKVP